MKRGLQIVYGLLAIAGAVVPWIYNVRWMLGQHRPMTAVEFVRVGFTGSALLGSLAADFWIGTSAALVFRRVA